MRRKRKIQIKCEGIFVAVSSTVYSTFVRVYNYSIFFEQMTVLISRFRQNKSENVF